MHIQDKQSDSFGRNWGSLQKESIISKTFIQCIFSTWMLFHYKQRLHIQLIELNFQLTDQKLVVYQQRDRQSYSITQGKEDNVLKVRQGCVLVSVR